jgi:citrate synthase
MRHTFLHVRVSELMQTFNYDSHPMGMFISGIAAMSTFHPEANPSLAGSDIFTRDKKIRNKQFIRILGKVPTLAAMSYRHRIGRPFNMPQNNMTYAENFLYMLDHLTEDGYKPNPKLARALDILFILHADHELNCSTAAMRHIGSSLVDPYSAIAGAASALYGPLHGGANEAVVRMLEKIGTVDKIPAFIEAVKKKEKKLMGFGHR